MPLFFSVLEPPELPAKGFAPLGLSRAAGRSACPAAQQAAPAQLAYGRDMVLPVDYETNWGEITKRKQKRINENNDRESKAKLRKLSQPRKGPYRILKVNGNGSLKIQLRPCVADVANTRRAHPFFEKWPSTFCKLGSKAAMEAGAVILPYLGIP